MMSHTIKQYIPTALIIYVCLCTPYTPALHAKLSEKSQAQRKRSSKKKKKLKNGLIFLSTGFFACLIGYATYNKGTDEDPNNTPSSNIPSEPNNTSSPEPSPILGKVPSNNTFSPKPPPVPPSNKPLSSDSEQPVLNDDFPENEEIQKLQTEIAGIKQNGGLEKDLTNKKEKFKQLIESSKPWIYCDSTSKNAGAIYTQQGQFISDQSTEKIKPYLRNLAEVEKRNLNIEFQTNYNKLKDYAEMHNDLKEQYNAFKLFIQLIQDSLYDNSSKVDDTDYTNLSSDDIITKFNNLYRQQYSNAKKYFYKMIDSSDNRQQMVASWLYSTLINIYTKVDTKYKAENQKNKIQQISDKKAFWFSPGSDDSNTIEFNSNAQTLITNVEEEILQELPNTLGKQYPAPAHKELINPSQQKSDWKKFITDTVKVCFHIVSNQDPGLVIETNTDTHQGVTYHDKDSDDDDDDDSDDDFEKNYMAVGRTIDGAQFSYIVWPAIYSKKGSKLSKTHAIFK